MFTEKFISREELSGIVKEFLKEKKRGNFTDHLYEKHGILYINVKHPPSNWPVVDMLTLKITRAFRFADRSPLAFAGIHTCLCGAKSESSDYILSNKKFTNSLCIHYMAFHRPEIPWQEIVEILKLENGDSLPSRAELAYPLPTA